MNVDSAVTEFADKHQVEKASAVRGVMALAALEYAGHLPVEFLPGLLAAASKNLVGEVSRVDLEATRVAAWQHQKKKHSDSGTTVKDDADRAMRLLIGIAWDDDLPEEDISDAMEYLDFLLNQ